MMSEDPSDGRPPLLSGGAKRRLFRRRPRPPRRGPRFSRVLLLVPIVGGIALAAIILGSSGGGGGSNESAKTRPDSLAEAVKPPPSIVKRPGPTGAGGGDTSRFAVNLTGGDLVHLRFSHRPRAGLLFDVRTGRVLWRLDPTRRLPIASLTKMMTALVVVERRSPHERVRITPRARHTPGSAVGVLPKRRKVQLEALLNGLLLVSGNDAAVALAQHTGGSVPGFVRMMNERARQLGLSCTHYTSPHGLQDAGNHSCAADLATLARADLHLRRIRRIVRRQRAILTFPIKGGRLFLYNNNPLMRAGYRGVTGLKTGYTDAAGHSIVATAKRGNVELGVVLLHAYNIGDQSQKLLERGFKALRAGG
jgi:serine-type D-Ala-D-Ala carboxypeptidase (penicillin-binding protein 5/6)